MDEINTLSAPLPSATKSILEQIVNHNRVNGYRIVTCDEQCVIIECQWRVNLGSRDVDKGVSGKGVRSIEPVCWHIPFNFPQDPIVPSLRADFPRTQFPHINPSEASGAVWPCITEINITGFLLAHGLQSLLVQMDSWLDRAALDRLMLEEQGWEPILFNNFGGCFVDVNSNLISSAIQIGDKQSTTTHRGSGKGAFHTLSNNPLYVTVDSVRTLNQQAQVDVLTLTLPASTSSKQFQNVPVGNRTELISFAESLGGKPDVSNQAIVLLTPELSDSEWLRIKLDKMDQNVPRLKEARDNSQGQHAIGCVVVFCIPRPIKLIGGNSNIEIVPFFVRLSDVPNGNPEVAPLRYIQGGSAEVLQKVSRPQVRATKIVAFLGAGSVGSKIGTSLARSGSYTTHFVDNGTFRPHNMARYGISNVGHCEGWPKAMLLDITIGNMGVQSGFSLDDLSKGEISLPSDTDVIIESTGNELVSYNLSSQKNFPGRLYQVGLYGQSSMGYLAIEPQSKLREVRIDDIEAMMYSLSLSEPKIYAALYGHPNAERQLVGYGCSSETTIMPDTVLSLCCSAITNKIDESIYLPTEPSDAGELHLCFRGEDSSISWKSYSLPPTQQVTFVHANRNWDVRISGYAVDSMYTQQTSRLPSETGGAIIGYVCELTGRIYVTDALPPFPLSVESPAEFTFNQSQLHELDMSLRKTSMGRIYVLGTWHTHTFPSSPSSIDVATLQDLNSTFDLPVTTMLMCDGKSIVAVESNHSE